MASIKKHKKGAAVLMENELQDSERLMQSNLIDAIDWRQREL